MFDFRRIKLIPYRKAEYNQLSFPLARIVPPQTLTNSSIITTDVGGYIMGLSPNYANEALSIQMTSLIVALLEKTFDGL